MILQGMHRGRALSCLLLLAGCDLPESDDHGHFQVGDVDVTAECGGSQKFFPLALYNYTDRNVEITDARLTGGFSILDPLPITLRGGETGAITVRAPALVPGTDLANNRKPGELVLSTSEGDFPVVLAAQINGANLMITDAADKPLALAFSGAQCPPPITAKLTNWGDRGMVFSAPASTGFAFDGFVAGTIGPGETKMITVRPVTTSACTGTEALTFTGTGPMCSLPVVIQASFSLTGTPTCSCP